MSAEKDFLNRIVMESSDYDEVFSQGFFIPFWNSLTDLLGARGIKDVKPQDILNLSGTMKAADSLFAKDATNVAFLNRFGGLVWTKAPDLVGKGKNGQLCRTFGNSFDSDLIDAAAVKKLCPGSIDDDDKIKLVAQVRQMLLEALVQFAKTSRQRAFLNMRTDMFVDAGELQVLGDRVEYVRPFEMPRYESDARGGEVAEDFHQHFPEFYDFLEMLCAARFAPDRRQAFLWLNCPKSWGKNFLLSALANLGLVCELSSADVERCFEGAPVGINTEELVTAWVLAFDETRNVKAEIKQLSNSITAAPKNQMRSRTPVYLKLFMSAEGIDSLAGEAGVEAQFAERFSLITGKEQRVQDRVLFKELGPHAYLRGLTSAVAEHIQNYVRGMRTLGPDAAALRASQALEKLHAKHKISNTHHSLEDTVKELGVDLRQLLSDFAKWQLSGMVGDNFMPASVAGLSNDLLRKLKASFGRGYLGSERSPVYYLKTPVTFVKEWIKIKVDRSEAVKVTYKAREIAQAVSEVPIGVTSYIYASPNDTNREQIKAVVFAQKQQLNKAKVVPIRSPGDGGENEDISFF